jgi:hypothetical protein
LTKQGVDAADGRLGFMIQRIFHWRSKNSCFILHLIGQLRSKLNCWPDSQFPCEDFKLPMFLRLKCMPRRSDFIACLEELAV